MAKKHNHETHDYGDAPEPTPQDVTPAEDITTLEYPRTLVNLVASRPGALVTRHFDSYDEVRATGAATQWGQAADLPFDTFPAADAEFATKDA